MRFLKNVIPVLVLVLSGCKDATAAANADILGRWNLSTIDGASLPYLIEVSDGQRLELVADDLSLNENGTLTGSTSLRLVQNGQTIDSDVFHQTGTWTRSGNTISMLVTEDGQSFNSTATVLNGTLSANIDGVVYIYRR